MELVFYLAYLSAPTLSIMNTTELLTLANTFLNNGGDLLAKFPAFCLIRACELASSIVPCSAVIDSSEVAKEYGSATVTIDGQAFPVSMHDGKWVTGII